MNNYGALPPKIDLRDYKYKPVAGAARLPEQFMLVICDVKNQGSVNSCVAHAAAEIAEVFNLRQEQKIEKLSPGFIYGTRYSYTGEGMYLRDALKTLFNKGICPQLYFPRNLEVPYIIECLNKTSIPERVCLPNKISSYFNIDCKETNENYSERDRLIKKSLMDNGPVMVSLKWYDDFKVINSKIHTLSQGNYGYHCVVIYGWVPEGWIILNSWGKNWGEGGSAIYPFDFPIEEAWGITDTIINKDVKIKKTNKFTKIVYKVLNFIINFCKDYNSQRGKK